MPKYKPHKPSEDKFLKNFDDFCIYTIKILKDEEVCPKSARWLGANEIIDIVQKMHTSVHRANNIKVIVKALPEKFGKERRALRKMKKKLDRGEITIDAIADHYQSVRAGLSRCDGKTRVKSLDEFYSHLFGVAPPKSKRRKRNAYSKSKRGNRKKRNRKRKTENRE